MWNLTSFSLETVLLSVQDRCTVCTKRTISLEIILDAPNGTHRWSGSCESSVHLEIVLILTQDSYTICVERTTGSKIVLAHSMELLGDVGHVESCFFLFEDMEFLGDMGHVESCFFPFEDSVSVGAI
jgi:hypothetical protein